MTSKKLMGLCLWLAMLSVIVGAGRISLQTNKTVDVRFLNNEARDRALVFFGFSQCHDICPTTLISLGNVYRSQENVEALPAVYFIDIDRESNGEQAQQYAENFYQGFKSHFPNDAEFNQIKNAFGLNIFQRGSTIRHRGFLHYLERHDGNWVLKNSTPPSVLTEKHILKIILKRDKDTQDFILRNTTPDFTNNKKT